MNPNPINAYRQTRVKTASQGKLIVMLYDEAIRQIDLATQLLSDDGISYDRVNNAIGKAQDIITELTVSLDLENGGEIAQNLFRLYRFFNNQLVEANFKKDPKPLESVRSFLVELRDAWKEVADKGYGPERATSGVNISS
ncbi:MAG: flagellar export chaperone FliS [Spirochaetota bacterium]